MKEHVQDYGVRKWAGDDLIELQSEPLSALQALVSPYAPCILTGCELETVPDGDGDYRLHAGYVALKGRKTVENGAGTETDNGETAAEEYVKIVRVSAQTVKQPTVFLTLGCTPLSRAYGNGENKAIAYDYTAEVCDVLSEVGDRPYLELVADADNPRLPDKLGITRKLNRDGGEATDTVVTFTETGNQDEPEDLKSGLTLGVLISRIKKWLGKKVDKKDGYELSKNDFTDGLKTKLEGFTHPAGGDLTGSYPNPTIKNSVNLSGSPTTITPAASDNSTRVATTAYVKSNLSSYAKLNSDINSLISHGNEFNFANETCSEVWINFRRGTGIGSGGIKEYHFGVGSGGHNYADIIAKNFIFEDGASAVKFSDARLSDSRTPKGSASGDLTGVYPNPTIKSSVNLSGNPTVTGNLTVNGTGESLIKGNLRLRGSGNYGNKIIFGDGDYVYLHEATDDKLTIYSKAGIDFSASSTSQPFNVKGLLQENGSRVYSPNNKPTPSALGAAASSHSHSIVSSSNNGFMSSNDKIKLDKMIFVGRVDNNEITVINGSYTSFEKKATGIYRLAKTGISVSSAIFVTIRGGHKTLFSSVSHAYGYCEIYITDESKNSVDANFAIMVWG